MSFSSARSVFPIIKKYVFFSFLSELAPIYPAYMILFRERGYDFLELSLLFVVWELSVVVLELPSGILADRWDKRKVLAVGMLLKALGFCAWLLLLLGLAHLVIGYHLAVWNLPLQRQPIQIPKQQWPWVIFGSALAIGASRLLDRYDGPSGDPGNPH